MELLNRYAKSIVKLLGSNHFPDVVESKKSTFYPYVLFLAMAAILVGLPGHMLHC